MKDWTVLDCSQSQQAMGSRQNGAGCKFICDAPFIPRIIDRQIDMWEQWLHSFGTYKGNL